jgi:Tol biopolymer transport system component
MNGIRSLLHRACGRLVRLRPVRLGTTVLVICLAVSAVASALAGITTRVSIAADGSQADADSHEPAISADGRFIAFDSWASNLVPGDTNGRLDIFVHDRQTGLTERVSLAADGSQANGHAEQPTISADGRYVAFRADANNLVPGDTNNNYDIFVHDRQTGETERVSVASDGTQANLWSGDPAISADGQLVAFMSYANNLVPDDTNECWSYVCPDIFVHNRQSGLTERVSLASDGAQANHLSRDPALSADGRFVAFESYASNLVPGDPTGTFDIFVHDRQTGTTGLVSLAADGAPADGPSLFPTLSADGRFIAYTSAASNLDPGDTTECYNDVIFNCWDVFVYDQQTGTTKRVSVASDGTQGTGSTVHLATPSLSTGGRLVAFSSGYSNLVAGDTNGVPDVFVHDLQTGMTERVAITADGTQADFWSHEPDISADGRFVAFYSGASNLVPGDTNGQSDVFVYERDSPAALAVALDIKPGSFPNHVNPRSNGVIPVTLLTTDSFAASTADPTTLRFGVTGQEAVAVHSALADVDDDGDIDLMLHFQTQATGIECGMTSAALIGETVDGLAIHGFDSIQTTGCH